MKSENVLSFLGIAQKARKLISGQDTVERLALLNRIFLIIVSEDASLNTKEKMMFLCKSREIPLYIFSNSEVLGKAIGKEGRKVIGVTDKGFARELINRLNLLTGVGNIDENKGIRTC